MRVATAFKNTRIAGEIMSQLFLFVGATDEWHLGERGRTQDAALTQVVASRARSFEVSLGLHLLEALCSKPGTGDFWM